MKFLFFFFLFSFFWIASYAQNGDFEIKVISDKYATVKGQLKKVSAEGIGVEDYKGNYFIFRPSEIKRIKIRKRGLTIAEGLGVGTVTGLSLGAGIWSLDENGSSTEQMIALTAVLTGTGAVSGTIVGAITEIANTKLIIKVKGNEDAYKIAYKKLDKYVNAVYKAEFN